MLTSRHTPYRCTLLVLLLLLTSCSDKFHLPRTNSEEVDNATLIVIAFPQEIVRTTPALYSKLIPLIGFGRQGAIRAGHASFVLAKEGGDSFEYFDLGRYSTPKGYSRVRGENTDPELKIAVKPQWRGKKLLNCEELLQWIYNHPQQMRGAGEVYASVCDEVNYEVVKRYTRSLQEQGLIAYGPFVRGGSNCTRFVANALLCGALDHNQQKRVERLFRLTPSGLGNISAANSYDYHYIAGADSVARSTASLKRMQRRTIIDWGRGEDYKLVSKYGTTHPPLLDSAQPSWRWLSGGSLGCWFEIVPTTDRHIFLVSRYNERGECDFSAHFKADREVDPAEIVDFEPTYVSHYEQVVVKTKGGEELQLTRIEPSLRL